MMRKLIKVFIINFAVGDVKRWAKKIIMGELV